MVSERFGREAPTLKKLPALRYDTSYRETRTVSYDAFVDVRGNRYSVPAACMHRPMAITHSGPCRSGFPEDGDHSFRTMAASF